MQDFDVQIDIVPRMFEILGPNAQLHTSKAFLWWACPSRGCALVRFLKRALDLVGAASVSWSSRRCFSSSRRDQARLARARCSSGRCGWGRERTFPIFKFRTMVADAEERKAELAHLNMHREAAIPGCSRSRTTRA